MIKIPSDGSKKSDDELLRLLKQNAPAPWISRATMDKLENHILALTAHMPQSSTLAQAPMLVWFFRGWTPRAAALAALLAITSGFVVGQVSYGNQNTAATDPTVMAFTDKASNQADFTDSLWGDSDDDDAE